MKISKVFVFLFPALLFAMLWDLGSWGVLETSEARYAEISREMLSSGRWFMPQLLGIYHFDKPLMTYWITASGMSIFGVNAFGARFFLQLAYLLQVFLVSKIALGLFNSKRKAIYAAIIYAGLPLVLISVINLTTDAFLNTFELLGVYLLIRYYRHRNPVWLYLFFFDLGLALFTKGPVGILIPVLMIYPIRKILKVEGAKNKLHLVPGILLTILIGSSWFIFLMIKSTEFYDFFVGEQLIDRMFKASGLKRSKPFWYYLAYLPITLLPVFLLIPEAIVSSIKQKVKTVNLLSVFGLLIPFLFFSASSSKLVLYVLPLSPFVALTAAWFIDEKPLSVLRKYYFFSWGFYLLLILGMAAFLFGLIPDFSIDSSFSAWFFLLVGLGLLIFLIIRISKSNFVFLALLMPLSIIPISKSVMAEMEIQINGMAPVARFLEQNNIDNRKVIAWDIRLSSLSFELEEDIYSVYNKDYSLQRHTEFQENTDWKENLIDVNQPDELSYLKGLIESPSVFIVKKKRLPEEYLCLISSYGSKKSFGKWDIYY